MLRGEESVQLRLMAMDQLVDSDLAPERLVQAMRDLTLDDNPALQVRAARYIPVAAGDR